MNSIYIPHDLVSQEIDPMTTCWFGTPYCTEFGFTARQFLQAICEGKSLPSIHRLSLGESEASLMIFLRQALSCILFSF